jgi:hypothetical protein
VRRIASPGPFAWPPGARATEPDGSPVAQSLLRGTGVRSLVPGATYRIGDQCCVGTAGIFLTAPAGWETFDPILIGKNVLGDPALYDILLGAHLVGNVYTGGCQWQGTLSIRQSDRPSTTSRPLWWRRAGRTQPR